MLFCILALTACQIEQKEQSKENQILKEKTVKIGVITDHTGPIAPMTTASRNAVELALEDWKHNPGNKANIELIYEDHHGKTADAVSAYHKLVNLDDVSAIITDISIFTVTLAPLVEKDEIPLIAYLSTAPSVWNISPYVYRTSPMNLVGMQLDAKNMVQQDIQRVNTITELFDYPIAIQQVFKEEYEKAGGNIMHDFPFEASKDVRTIIAKAISDNPQAIMIFTQTPASSIKILEQLKELQINVTIHGSEHFGTDMIQRLVDDELLEGIYVSSPLYNEDRILSIKERYIKTYGEDIVLDWLYVATGYDAAMILFQAIENKNTNGKDIKRYLDTAGGFNGLTGINAFDEHGDPALGKYALFQFQDGKKVKVEI